MLVYLVRHGEAVPEQVDPKRPLSAKGRNEVEATARQLQAEGAKVDEIWHSSKLRAKQTAEILARDLGVSRVIEKKGLKPDDDPTPIAEELQMRNTELRMRNSTLRTPNSALQRAPQSILIAGHLPFIPKLVQLLKPEMGKIELKTGGVVRVEV